MIDHPELDEFETVPQPSMTITISHADPRALDRALLAAFDAVATIGGVELQVLAEGETEPPQAEPVGARAVGAAVCTVFVSSALGLSALIGRGIWGLFT